MKNSLNDKLKYFYGNQFYQNEEHVPIHQGDGATNYIIVHTPVYAGTMTGMVCLEDTKIQTFVVKVDGQFVLYDIDEESDIRCISGDLNGLTGEINLIWTQPPGKHKIIINYESSSRWQGEKRTGPNWCDENDPSVENLNKELKETKTKLREAELRIDRLQTVNSAADYEVKLYEEYENKLKDIKEFMIRKLDQFLKLYTKDELRVMMKKPTVEIFDEAMES